MVAVLLLGSIPFWYSQPGRALVSILCVILLAHSWFVQRTHSKPRPQLIFLTLALSLPALAAIFLGLNVILYYTYNSAAEGDPRLHEAVGNVQTVVGLCAVAVAVILFFWMLLKVAYWLAARVRG